MEHASLDAFLSDRAAMLADGPVALIFAEDAVELESTIRHHLGLGFPTLLLLGQETGGLPRDLLPRLHRIAYDTYAEGALPAAVNRLIAAAPGTWFYYGYNA